MATALKSQRMQSWLLGEILHKGQPVEVWQRCTADDLMSVAQEGRLEDAVLTTPSGATAKLPAFYHVDMPRSVRRVLIVHPINHQLVGVTLRLPDLDIDIEHSVLLDP